VIRCAIIGWGAIGRMVARILAAHPDAAVVTGVLRRGAAAPALPGEPPRMATVAALLAPGVDVVVECAGHAALREHGPAVLAAGRDLLVASVGALADPLLEATLVAAARGSGARLLVPAGALGGLDALAAARLAGLDSVAYESTKAPAAWRGTPAEAMVDLDALHAPHTFLETNARDAARRFPQNANVAAAVALAGLGFERTRVRLVADPAAAGNRHRIEARGAFGEIDVLVLGRVLPDNPKSSVLAPHSLAHAVLNRGATIGLA
jgi:aspartate dehydrogenase